MFAFLYVKAISTEIFEEISFPSFFQKNADVSISAGLRLIISKKCVATPIFLCRFQQSLQRSSFSAWSSPGTKTFVFRRHCRPVARIFYGWVRSVDYTDQRAPRRSLLGGSGGMPPREILKIKLSETAFRTF